MSESSKRLKLNNGLEIPMMGLGTTRLRNLDDANKSLKDDDRMKDVEDSVYYSIKHGVRLIDTASNNENEVEVGKGIKKAIDEGIVKREDLFVVTKMWLDEKEDPEDGEKDKNDESEEKDSDESTEDKKDSEDEDDKKKKTSYSLDDIVEYQELLTKFSDLEAKYNDLETKYNDLVTEKTQLESELQPLRDFKLAADRKAKEDMINGFYMLDDEAKKDVRENIDKYSLDDIEAKLSILCVRNKVSFNLEDDNNPKGPITYNLGMTDFDESTPAWVKAVLDTAKTLN